MSRRRPMVYGRTKEGKIVLVEIIPPRDLPTLMVGGNCRDGEVEVDEIPSPLDNPENIHAGRRAGDALFIERKST